MATALEGIRRSEERVLRAAERLARLPLSADGVTDDVVDISSETVALLEARSAHAANTAVAQTAQQLEQHLLDILG
jgi:flagellar hook protein FlgE